MVETGVLLVDDHQVVRAGLRMLLESEDSFAVVGEAGTLSDAIDLTREVVPDVVVLDLQLADEVSLPYLDFVTKEYPEIRVVVLTMHENDEYLWAALRGGAAGYVLKKSADVDLVTAIRTVMDGGAYVDTALTSVLVEGMRDADATPEESHAEAQDTDSLLSDREMQVARRVSLGHTNAEIGNELYLSVKTVETYRSRAMSKLGLLTRAELVRHALEAGWFAEEDVTA